MSDLAERIAALSAEKRAVLEQMLAKQGLSVPRSQSSGGGVQRIAAHAIDVVDWGDGRAVPHHDETTGGAPAHTGYTPAEKKATLRQLYNAVSQQLDAGIFGKYAMFLNYGYKDDGSPSYAQVELSNHYLNRNCVRLVLELVGDCVIRGGNVLDVGCGRGGTLSVIDTFFEPRMAIGIDLSSRAIAFCHASRLNQRTQYLEGDAENIPFQSARFDVVTNVESSHNYPNIRSFYSEVFRVLRPDGYFLYTDLIRAPMVGQYLSSLQNIGFVLELERDITANVLLSCDEIAEGRQVVFGDDHDRTMVAYLLGIPGSEPYEDMKSGRSTYRIFRFRKV